MKLLKASGLPIIVIGSWDTLNEEEHSYVSVFELMNNVKGVLTYPFHRTQYFRNACKNLMHFEVLELLVANGLSAMFDEGDENLMACLGVYYISNGVPTNSALSRLSETRDEYLEYLSLLDLLRGCETRHINIFMLFITFSFLFDHACLLVF